MDTPAHVGRSTATRARVWSYAAKSAGGKKQLTGLTVTTKHLFTILISSAVLAFAAVGRASSSWITASIE